MKIRFYADETINVDLSAILAGLKELAPSYAWATGNVPFRIIKPPISNPTTYQTLDNKLRTEIKNDDFAFLFTEHPYDNNYFWDSGTDKAIIVSLFGWEHLTNLPRSNGIVYFIVALLVRMMGVGKSHRGKNTGCINDFWQDKTGIDSGMRAAYICAECLGNQGGRAIKVSDVTLHELKSVLDDLSQASRANDDITEFWGRTSMHSTESLAFDVFMCHNSKDKDAVRALNKQLKTQGLKTWLDEEQLPPGRVWQELLEQQIESIRSVAVFVGAAGVGPWQDVEMRVFLSEFVNRRCPVIPVILSDCTTVPQLPLFMRQFTWVDFRKRMPTPLDQLVWGITGERPDKDV
ncbi:MAG TPA: toll/interleukin-1 receptor domain-containing protein [Balneolales bacterium]|nr:toll/interleukin-1 receptor domain-containing protein [Balneolales bacterium]